ncbi:MULTISPECIES: TetR/AcrR family transcriptional regulator [unclassified Phenylobacterium]|uniref:TetR/AcrR family transcriptional regulator n=1 Tax=unclassified Phenylobacterium TaxID=2640670 RepID=UPI000B11E92D|nr:MULTISPECIES: TetR/AcrR family transcriptional regulator [unclassified Phenylobacterium]
MQSAAARRNAIAAAALRVMQRHGLDGLKVRAIAAEAGASTGAITHHFPFKSDLLAAASELLASQVRARVKRAEAARPALVAIRRTMRYALPLTPEMRAHWRVWISFWARSSDANVARILRSGYADWHEQLTELVGRAQSEGDVAACADPAFVARGLAAMVDGVAIGMLRDGSRLATQRRLATLHDWLNVLRQTG